MLEVGAGELIALKPLLNKLYTPVSDALVLDIS